MIGPIAAPMVPKNTIPPNTAPWARVPKNSATVGETTVNSPPWANPYSATTANSNQCVPTTSSASRPATRGTRLRTYAFFPPIRSMRVPTVIRPTMLDPPITVSSIADVVRVMPRSIPCTAMCSGTVTREGKNRNWVAHRVQNARLRRTSANGGPRRSMGRADERLFGGASIQ